MGAFYIINCSKCKIELIPMAEENPTVPGGIMSSHYIGMTVTSIHNRMLSHLQSHRSKSRKSVMYRHDMDEHNSEVQIYTTDYITTAKRFLRLCMRKELFIENRAQESL